MREQTADYERAANELTRCTPRLDALSRIEALAAQALFAGDTAQAREEAEHLVRRLVEPDPSATRRHILAVELATAHATVNALQAILGSALKKRDENAARLLSRLLTDAVRRVAILASAHAGSRARPVLMVGHADQVSVSAGGQL